MKEERLKRKKKDGIKKEGTKDRPKDRETQIMKKRKRERKKKERKN
jgi:hypothetical protein